MPLTIREIPDPEPDTANDTANDTAKVTCPDWRDPAVSGDQIIGCGSSNVYGPDGEGFYDCACGIWFKPESRPADHRP